MALGYTEHRTWHTARGLPTTERRRHAVSVPFQSAGGLQTGPWGIGKFMSFRSRKRVIRYLN